MAAAMRWAVLSSRVGTVEPETCASVGSPGSLGAAAHYLPAAFLAFNVNAEAVSTDLNPLAP